MKKEDAVFDTASLAACADACIAVIKRANAQRTLLITSMQPPSSITRALQSSDTTTVSVDEYANLAHPETPYDLGFAWLAFSSPLNDMDLHCIARLRDVDCRHLCIAASSACRLEMEALGLHCVGVDAAKADDACTTKCAGKYAAMCFEFNIADYKRTPDWLNSRYWANPQRWNKERW